MLAVRRGDAPELPAPARSWLALCRRDYKVTLTELDEQGHELLSALLAGGEVRVDERVHAWAEAGFFRSVRVRAQPAEEAIR
jgi:hypothetical protein